MDPTYSALPTLKLPIMLLIQILALMGIHILGVQAHAGGLWYAQPGNDMHDAIPIGNGRLGAMVYGRTDNERISLNEDSIVNGPFQDRVNANSLETLAEVRRLMDSDELAAADAAYLEGMAGTPDQQRAYQPAGQLIISTGHAFEDVQGYNRSLDLSTSVATVVYEYEGVTYKREAVASNPAGVVAVRFTATEPSLSLSVKLERDQGVTSTDVQGDSVIMNCHATEEDFYKFASGLRIVTSGDLSVDGDSHVISGADFVEIFYDAETPFYHPDGSYLDALNAKLDAAIERRFEAILSEAIEDYSALYSRATLTWDNPEPGPGLLATDVRLAASNSTGDFSQDPTLLILAYNFGRYLLISSSRADSVPANLQGTWNEDFSPGWGSKYTININTEMNYWLAEANDLPEVQVALWNHLMRARERGTIVAREMYNCSGWVAHHNLDLWSDCAPQDSLTQATAWPTGAVWLTNQAMDHFRFTHDVDFAKEIALPLAAGVLDFIADFAVAEDDRLIIYPSNSPEISLIIPNGQPGAGGWTGLAKDTQMDRALVWDLCTSYIEIAEAVGHTEGVDKARDVLARTGPPTVSSTTGRLTEWDVDYAEGEPGHRHFSSIYGLYPGRQYSPLKGNQTVLEGALALLDYRMENGSGSTGWSRVWAALLRARAFQGDVALDDTHYLLGHFTSDNLFSDAHGVVQMDATFGIVSAVNEMFLQSNNDLVHIGPAIPSTIASTGQFSGWVARGSFVVDASWVDGQVSSATIASRDGRDLAIRVQDGREFFVNGETYREPFATEVGGVYKVTLET